MRKMTDSVQAIKAAYNDIMRYRVYFGDSNPATASVFNTDPINIFGKGQGSTAKNATTGADVTLRECDTSLFNDNGIIPKAQNFQVQAIGIDIHQANVVATVPYTDDTITQIDVNPLQGVNPYPLVDAIRSQGVFTLWRNSTEFLEQGNVADYPCGLWASGWGSDGSAEVSAVEGGAAEAYNVNGFMMVQNGYMFRPLTVWHILDELDQFHGKFQMCRSLLLTGTGITGYIDFLLLGQCNVDRQSQQLIQQFN